MIIVPVEKVDESGELEDIYFDVTILIDKDNYLTIVDNSQFDWREFVDGNTLTTKRVKLSV